MKQVLLSYGGGKDSTAIVAIDQNRDEAAEYLGIDRQRIDKALPHFNKAVFADPGAEFGATYRTVRQVEKVLGDRFFRVLRDGENIAEWCKRLGIVPVMPGGSHICSKKFKGDVLAAWAKEQGISEPVWLIGIEADEGRRIKRFTAPKGDSAEYLYPLVDLELTRDRLDDLLGHLGWEDVHKSSCVFCPFMSEDEIKDLYVNHKDEWQLVVEIEDGFQEMSALKHQRWIDAGQPLNRGGRAPKGMWREDSWANGNRLFAKTVGGKRLSVHEWADRFEASS